ncbi:NAD(P)-binding protein [Trichoderma longibrachiatum]
MPSTPWIFICPSSRGIGNALTRHVLRRTARLPTSVPILSTTRHADPGAAKAALLRDIFPKSSAPASVSFTSSSPSSNGKPQRLQQQQQRQRDELSKRLFVVRCDVTDESTVASAAEEARRLFPGDTHHLHLACVLPGVLLNPEKSPAQVDADAALQSFRVNAVGQMLVAKHFFDFLPRRATAMPAGYEWDDEADEEDEEDDEENGYDEEENENGDEDDDLGEEEEEDEAEEEVRATAAPLRLPQHATWLSMSARVGSTTDNLSGGWFSYRASKAAVNSITRSLDFQLRARAGDNAMAVAYHPGTVKTDLSRDFWGGVPEEKLFSPEYAAERLVDVVCGLGVEDRGRCWDWKGTEVPP